MNLGFNALFLTDGYKIGHKRMLAPGTTRLYGTWIPRSIKHAPKGVDKVVSFGHQVTMKFLHEQFQSNFFNQPISIVDDFQRDMELYLGLPFDAEHFRELHTLGYLPIRIKALPEGIRTNTNIPHMTFVNTVDGFAWLTLYLETIISSLAWKASTSATLAYQYRKIAEKWVEKTDPENMWLVDFLCHDFSARGLSPWDMISSGLGHATSFRGSDTLPVIPIARYFYNEPLNEVVINSVNASEHSVTCTGIFYYERKLKKGFLNHEIERYYSFDAPCEGSVENPDFKAIAEWLNLRDWLKKFPVGILSVVSDTFDLWKLITYILPRLKEEILARDGKLVIRPDSGDPVDIICGKGYDSLLDFGNYKGYRSYCGDKDERVKSESEWKGVIELLWDIFGGTTNAQGYKVLDSHIGAIYGDSITLDRQVKIYDRLAKKGFAATNIVLGVGSYTYQMNTRDTLGYAAKGAWFEVEDEGVKTQYSIYKDPVTDDGTKKSLKGLQAVGIDENYEYYVKSECTWEEENQGLLQTIYENGNFFNQVTLEEIRQRLNG